MASLSIWPVNTVTATPPMFSYNWHAPSPSPSDPVAINISDADLRNAVSKSDYRRREFRKGQGGDGRFWGKAQGLDAIGSDKYEVLSKALDRLKLDASDILPLKKK